MSICTSTDLSPVLITGAWRSGTTLISRIMNNHPDLDVTYDTVHFLRFSLNKYDPISDRKNVERLIKDTSKRLNERYNLELSVNDTLNALNKTYSYSSAYDSIMKNLFLKKSHKRIWGEKTNLAWTKVPDFMEMFPEGRVIHIIRDPRAVLSSWKKFTHAPGNDYLDSILNCQDSMSKALYYQDVYAEKRYLMITYEDLVLNTEKVIKRVCKSLDISFNENMLDTSLFTNIRGEPWKANSIYNKNMSGISTAVVHKWKDELEDWEMLLNDIVMGELQKKFNYDESETTYREELIGVAIKEIQKSKLASEGLLQFLLSGKGHERYPSDPLVESNWSND
jgi:Sulfotransferase family